MNQCAREVALELGKTCYVSVIDEAVHGWALEAADRSRRSLALRGYAYIGEAKKDGVKVRTFIKRLSDISRKMSPWFECLLLNREYLI